MTGRPLMSCWTLLGWEQGRTDSFMPVKLNISADTLLTSDKSSSFSMDLSAMIAEWNCENGCMSEKCSRAFFKQEGNAFQPRFQSGRPAASQQETETSTKQNYRITALLNKLLYFSTQITAIVHEAHYGVKSILCVQLLFHPNTHSAVSVFNTTIESVSSFMIPVHTHSTYAKDWWWKRVKAIKTIAFEYMISSNSRTFHSESCFSWLMNYLKNQLIVSGNDCGRGCHVNGSDGDHRGKRGSGMTSAGRQIVFFSRDELRQYGIIHP